MLLSTKPFKAEVFLCPCVLKAHCGLCGEDACVLFHQIMGLTEVGDTHTPNVYGFIRPAVPAPVRAPSVPA